MSIQHFQTKLGINKDSIVTNSNDSVTLRLMTEHDLAMLYESKSISYRRVVGGEEARPTLADAGTVLAKRFSARVRHSIHCNAEWRADWVCPVTLLLERGRMVGRRNRSRSTRNRPVTGECITPLKAWEPSWFSSG